ncbi:rhomboid family intramembrane serine protease [Methylobacillus gramineus]|uniref:rhomboid family intramembrane serine protease n=1 Tax=Methylobacillus gramineus TaxID=755169 RepID=UPI001D000630|nr:rhomboid family intramembrane serine protease [Methylobacillus gramineus]MCB5184688.1 rhomboid family intramembrane serine protease [Methylobacillus gramineus]
MSDVTSNWPSLGAAIKQRTPGVPVTKLLIAANLLVFVLMLFNGAGFWHSPNNVQLAWGANFGPATQDGEWWRLATALFLHFGAVHLALNMVAFWDGGQLVERMYGHARYLAIYLISGLAGNLLSLVWQGNHAVSGGASGAIFGIYGALIVFLWQERKQLDNHEFRWLFGGACVFAIATIALGFMIPAIDNSAHIGGFVAGILSGMLLMRGLHVGEQVSLMVRVLGGILLLAAVTVMITRIPTPTYRWGDELILRKEIDDFVREDQAINRSWLSIMHESKQGSVTYFELGQQVEDAITDRYEERYEQLSQLPYDPALPSAAKLENILQYTKQRRDASKALADQLKQGKPPATNR